MSGKKAGISVLWKEYLHISLLFVLCSVLLMTRGKAEEHFLEAFSEKEKQEKTVIVIDAGHGGDDPGKVGNANSLEKEINLAIAKKTAELLEQDGYTVIMTRTEDCGLYPADSKNRKRDDMKERVRIITEAAPVLAVSIHQNSFPASPCKGAQMFYYKDSIEGKKLAEILQETFPQIIKDNNTRKARANSEYYLLRKAPCPIVIAECGFLSTPEEEALLMTEEYRGKVAEALRTGIRKYLELSSEGRTENNGNKGSQNQQG